MVPLSSDAVKVDFDSGQASLRVKNLGVYDDHDLANSLTLGLGLPGGALGMGSPAIPPVAPTRATVSFDIEWNGVINTAEIHNPTQTFQGTFLSTGATIAWSAEQPGFRFDAPADPNANLISVIGREQNGVFFS